MPDSPLNLQNIQGDILAGFFKDFETLIFFQIPDRASGGAWLAELIQDIANTDDVQQFNQKFKRACRRMSDPTQVMQAIWVNVAFTHQGLAALGVEPADLAAFPEEFRQGMRERAGLLGDGGASAPEQWMDPFRAQEIHGMLIVAADRDADCRAEVSRQERRMSAHGIAVCYEQPGHSLLDTDGQNHEHFGFRDGISQPGILGFTPPNNPQDHTQGDPGQDLIQPGEFVLGYPSESSPDEPEPVSPAWAADGSYLVLRRLRQDVQAFRDFVSSQARTEHFGEELMAAKLVGRYKSGAPLERTKDQRPNFDPERKDPSIRDSSILDDRYINNFEYGGDPDGVLVPRSAHIRKVYSRDQVPLGEDETRRRRLLRRGIPFGDPLPERAQPAGRYGGGVGAADDRGLLFICYQSSIASQFEYVQRRLVNNPEFPNPGDGIDPLISQSQGGFALPGGVQSHIQLMERWVRTTGGGYFFSP